MIKKVIYLFLFLCVFSAQAANLEKRLNVDGEVIYGINGLNGSKKYTNKKQLEIKMQKQQSQDKIEKDKNLMKIKDELSWAKEKEAILLSQTDVLKIKIAELDVKEAMINLEQSKKITNNDKTNYESKNCPQEIKCVNVNESYYKRVLDAEKKLEEKELFLKKLINK